MMLYSERENELRECWQGRRQKIFQRGERGNGKNKTEK